MSNSSQFMRVESYSKTPSKLRRRNGHRSAAEVVDELVREPHASPHVPSPKPPVVVIGNPIATLGNAYRKSEGAVDAVGRAQRRDAHILAGCVCSYPVPMAQAQFDEEEQARLGRWIEKCVNWAVKEFGRAQIDTIVLHQDESMPHLHIMLTPPAPGVEPSPLRRAAKAAVAAAIDKKHARKIERQAFKEEGRRLQDSFHSAVSIHFGHMRHGQVKRKRLSPLERNIELAQARSLREAVERGQAVEAQLQLQRHALESLQATLATKEKDLELREVDLALREHKVNKVAIRPAVEMVDALLKRVMVELHALLPAESYRAVESALRIARGSAGLGKLVKSTRSSAADVSDAQLQLLAQQVSS